MNNFILNPRLSSWIACAPVEGIPQCYLPYLHQCHLPPPPHPPTLSTLSLPPKILEQTHKKKKRSMQICVREIFTPAASSYSEDQSGREFHVLSDATARGRAECRNSGSLGTGGWRAWRRKVGEGEREKGYRGCVGCGWDWERGCPEKDAIRLTKWLWGRLDFSSGDENRIEFIASFMTVTVLSFTIVQTLLIV